MKHGDNALFPRVTVYIQCNGVLLYWSPLQNDGTRDSLMLND